MPHRLQWPKLCSTHNVLNFSFSEASSKGFVMVWHHTVKEEVVENKAELFMPIFSGSFL